MTFKDLIFEPHRNWVGKQAMAFFQNGYGVFVIQAEYSYTTGPDEYEVAVIKGNKESFSLEYSTGITDDVLGHLKEDDVTEVMSQVEALKA